MTKPDKQVEVDVLENELEDEEDDEDLYDDLSEAAFEPLLKTNQFTVRKAAAQALMDVALMMANISQLRTLISAGSNAENYLLLLLLVSSSLFLQMAFAFLVFKIYVRETEQNEREDYLAELQKTIISNKDKTDARFRAAKKSLTTKIARRQEEYRYHRRTSRLNYLSMMLVFLITVVNMFITGFGIKVLGSNNC